MSVSTTVYSPIGTDSHASGHGHPHQVDLATLPPIDSAKVRAVALLALAAGGLGFAALAVASVTGSEKFGVRDVFLGYTVGFVFWASLPLGAAALLSIAYLTSASWGVVLRRCFQAATRTLPLIGLLFCPVAAGLFLFHGEQSGYWWSEQDWAGNPDTIAKVKGLRPEAVKENQEKIDAYLNPAFFVARTAAVLTYMGVLSLFLNKLGRRAEDHGDEKALGTLKAMGGPGIIVWTLGMTVMATDWVMSVEPTWASSMFPIVFGMNMLLTAFATSILVFYSLNVHNAGVLNVVKDKFRIDMGTLLLGITMVWAYASFSQYMLIWAGNLPEELVYYRKRGDHGWEYLAYFLMAFHWLIPFVTLLFREVKTSPAAMRVLCVGLLAVCAADVVWWVLPAVEHPTGVLHVPLALAAVVGIGGAWGVLFAHELGKRPTLPANSEGQFLAGWGHH